MTRYRKMACILPLLTATLIAAVFMISQDARNAVEIMFGAIFHGMGDYVLPLRAVVEAAIIPAVKMLGGFIFMPLVWLHSMAVSVTAASPGWSIAFATIIAFGVHVSVFCFSEKGYQERAMGLFSRLTSNQAEY